MMQGSGRRSCFGFILFASVSTLCLCACPAAGETEKAAGYQGIWYANQPTRDEYVYKYSGGLATYCMKHIPMAVYAPQVNKTFFVYGGASTDGKSLLEMVSYYDHATGEVPRPTILMDKKTDDAHDNPVISLDESGYLWVFASSHGTARPSYIFRGKAPYNVDAFDQVLETNFSYPQPWYLPGNGFLFLHTRYKAGRGLYVTTSPDGRTWSDAACLAHIGEGHYQVSWPHGTTVGTAFDYHPKGKGLNFRTNLYYVATEDMGRTWKTAGGETVQTPLDSIHNPALVHDYEAEQLLVYVKDINYDAQGNPVILFVTSKGWEPGPKNAPHTWRLASWRAGAWSITDVAVSDNNYDSGSLYLGEHGAWEIIGPTEPGPQPYNPGGEIAVWDSQDDGATWTRTQLLTHGSPYNHSHVRRPLNAQPGFYAFWADGDTRKPSQSRLYCYDKAEGCVRVLPEHMDHDAQKPALLETGRPNEHPESTPEPAFAPIQEDPKLPRVLLIGDSISIGYTLPVRDLLRGKANVLRIPVNGGPTSRGVECLDQWLGNGKWDVIHFNWGLHDIKHMKDGKGDLAGEWQVSPDTYRKNLELLVTKLKATGAKLIWAATTPVPDGTDIRVQGEEKKINEIALDIMARNQIPVNDLHAWVLSGPARCQRSHNVHFTENGYRYLAEKVASAILQALADRSETR